MRIYVIDFISANIRVGEGHLHADCSGLAIGRGHGPIITIGIGPKPDDLCSTRRASIQRVIKSL
jgi:hypothetical protein